MYLSDLTVYYQLTDDEDVLFLLKNVDQLDNKAIEHDFIAKFLQVAEKYDLMITSCRVFLHICLLCMKMHFHSH